jgi:PST family polysaccharide transporter
MEEAAIRGVPWTVLSFAAGRIVSLLSMLVLARLLLPADFGLMALAATAINFLNWFGGLSFSGAVVVHQELDRRGQGTVLVLVVGTSALTAALAAGCAPLVAAVFDEPRLTPIMAALGGAILLTGLGSFYDMMLQGTLHFRARFVSLIGQSGAMATVSIALAVAGAGVWSLVGGQLAGALVYAVAMAGLSPVRVRPAWDPAVARRMAATGIGFFTQGITVFIRQNIDTVAVAKAFDARSLGFYSMANRLGDLTYWGIVDPVAKVTFPAFARGRHRGEDIRPAFLVVLRMVVFVACPLGILLSACARPLIDAAFGARWVPMEAPLAVFGLWAAVRPIEATLSWLLNSVRHAPTVARASILILVPMVPGVIVAASVGGLALVALVPLLDTVLAMGIFATMVRRHVDIALRDQWRAVRPVVLAGAPTWLAAHFTGRALATAPPVLALAGAVAAGLAVHALALTALEPGILPRTASQLSRVLARRRTAPATI